MASRKDLKKSIGYIIGDLVTECIVRYNYVPGTDKNATEECIGQLLDIYSEFVIRVSHTEPGQAKVYYRAFNKDFNDRLAEVMEKMTSLSAK